MSFPDLEAARPVQLNPRAMTRTTKIVCELRMTASDIERDFANDFRHCQHWIVPGVAYRCGCVQEPG